jgi:hypothetical protein
LIDNLSQNNPTPIPSKSDLSTYSLSFESDPIRKWWPLAPNHYEDITAALWKDSDGTNVSRFTNLQAEWQLDPQYFSVAYTSSQYFYQCPVITANNRPCIYFYASVRPNKPGTTSVQLKVKDGTGEEAWNAYPAVIEDISKTPVPTQIPTETSFPRPLPTPISTSIPIPVGNEYKNLEQKVTMLEAKIREQDVKLNQAQNILDRIMTFLRNLFNFNQN